MRFFWIHLVALVVDVTLYVAKSGFTKVECDKE